MTGSGKSKVSRRTFIKYTGASTVVAGLAGCSGGDGGGSDGGDGGDGGGSDGGDGGGSDGGGGSDSGDGGGDGGDGGSTGADNSVDEVRIGSNHPLSGFLAFDGQRIDKAIRLAAQLKNEEGGIESLGGAEVTVVSGDNEAKQELGGQVADRLINEDDVDLLLGSFTSPTTMAASNVAEREQTPMIITVATQPAILQDRRKEYVYRIQPNSTRQAQNYANWVPDLMAENDQPFETFGHLWVNNAFGESIGQPLWDMLEEQGIEVTATPSYQLGADNLNTQATKLKQADPDVVCTTTYAQGGLQMMNAFDNIDYEPTNIIVLASVSFSTAEIYRQMGEDVNGAVHLSLTKNPKNPRTDEMEKLFRERFSGDFDLEEGEELSLGASHFYGLQAAETAIKAFEKAGTTDKDALNEAIQNLVVEDMLVAMPKVDFREDGENKAAQVGVSQIQDLESNVVFPEQFAEAELQF